MIDAYIKLSVYLRRLDRPFKRTLHRYIENGITKEKINWKTTFEDNVMSTLSQRSPDFNLLRTRCERDKQKGQSNLQITKTWLKTAASRIKLNSLVKTKKAPEAIVEWASLPFCLYGCQYSKIRNKKMPKL